ncbi:MAG: flagellar basal body rod protein FlgC [Planctomycetes bacterium]|nr:flagellar basal body rod protein FlgC [Planctomycetota bacterium]
MGGINELFGGMRASSSALSAERTRIDVIAKNIANAESTSMPDGSGPYRRQVVNFAPFLDKAGSSGARVGSITSDNVTPFPVLHDPGHKDADPATGNVLMPNVNVVQEMADLILAMRSYEANLNTQDNFVKMAERALRIAQ